VAKVTAAITDVYMTDAITDATPLAQTLHAQGGVGTDIAGAALTIAGGIGTGTGVGGSIIFQTAVAGASSSTPNTLTTAFTIDQGGHTIFPLVNDAATPTLAFGDGDSGFYEGADDTLKISLGGVARWNLITTHFYSNTTSGASLTVGAATATAPAHTFTSDSDTGIGRAAADQLSLIAGGKEMLRLSETGVATTDQVIIGPAGVIGANATPSLAFGDGDTGFFEYADDAIAITIGGVRKWEIIGGSFQAFDTGGPSLRNEATSATNPVFCPRSGTATTGVGGVAGTVSLITNSLAGLTVDGSQNVVVGNAALGTTATDGFFYMPTCAGVPTGVPTAHTGRNPIVYDTTNDDFYVYEGSAWTTVGGGAGATTHFGCTADTTRNNSTTFVTITGLSASLAASTTYAVEILLQLDQGATAADIDVVFLVGTGATGNGLWESQGTTTTDNGIETAFATTGGSVTLITDVYANNVIKFTGWITTSGSGTANVQFAQNVAVANATTIKQGSWLKVVEL